MKIMLDNSPRMISEKEERFNCEFLQLRTPLTNYKLSSREYGLDNGCFSRFPQKKWEKLLKDAENQRPIFICLPDIVGDARRTMDLFEVFEKKLNGLPKALVLQDGIKDIPIPFNKIDAVFVGGTDSFKISPEAINACKAAKMLGKWVHVGRVNTIERVNNWLDIADSIDGSGISKYDHMLGKVVVAINKTSAQIPMGI